MQSINNVSEIWFKTTVQLAMVKIEVENKIKLLKFDT